MESFKEEIKPKPSFCSFCSQPRDPAKKGRERTCKGRFLPVGLEHSSSAPPVISIMCAVHGLMSIARHRVSQKAVLRREAHTDTETSDTSHLPALLTPEHEVGKVSLGSGCCQCGISLWYPQSWRVCFGVRTLSPDTALALGSQTSL